MYASYKSLKIDIQTKDKHIAKSPYILKGTEMVPYNIPELFQNHYSWMLFKIPVIPKLYAGVHCCVARGAEVYLKH